MTMAICINCGGEKFGAFGACDGCGFRPTSEEEMAKALMMTDHYFSKEKLAEIGADIKKGTAVTFNPENVAQCIQALRNGRTRRMLGLEPQTKKKPWWKFIG